MCSFSDTNIDPKKPLVSDMLEKSNFPVMDSTGKDSYQ